MSNTQNLSIGSGSGLQSSTQSPQTSTQSTLASGNQSQSVQSGTAASLLTTSKGIPLSATAVPSVGLSADRSTTQSAAGQAAAHHGLNPVLAGLSGLLCLVAVVLFISTFRTAKNTTK